MIMIGWHIISNYFTIYKWIICVPVRVCTNDCWCLIWFVSSSWLCYVGVGVVLCGWWCCTRTMLSPKQQALNVSLLCRWQSLMGSCSMVLMRRWDHVNQLFDCFIFGQLFCVRVLRLMVVFKVLKHFYCFFY